MAKTPTFTMPGSDLDLDDAQAVADLLHHTAQLNREDPLRAGCIADLPDEGQLMVTGDLHDNTPALERIIKSAELDQSPDHYVVLHELIHGPDRPNGMDLSIRTLASACAVKRAYPSQVFFLLSNHELAQRQQEHVFKEGGSDVDAFNDGLVHLYGDAGAETVHDAFDDYVDSLLLALCCENGVMVAHSLPAPRDIEVFDKTVLYRELTDADYAADGPACQMVWGRHQNNKLADELAEAWGVEVFLLGHQPAEKGWEAIADNILVLNSEHAKGVCLPVDLRRSYERDELIELIQPISKIRM